MESATEGEKRRRVDKNPLIPLTVTVKTDEIDNLEPSEFNGDLSALLAEIVRIRQYLRQLFKKIEEMDKNIQSLRSSSICKRDEF
jgi:hypothetical protein